MNRGCPLKNNFCSVRLRRVADTRFHSKLVHQRRRGERHPTALGGRNRRPPSWAKGKEERKPIPNARSHPPESRTGNELKRRGVIELLKTDSHLNLPD